MRWRVGSLANGFWTCFMGLQPPFEHVRGGPCQHRRYIVAKLHCWLMNHSPSVRL